MHKGLNLRGIVCPEDETRSIDAHNYAAMEDRDAAKERGEHPADELPEKKQEFNTKHRGLSADLVCVITGVERPGGWFWLKNTLITMRGKTND